MFFAKATLISILAIGASAAPSLLPLPGTGGSTPSTGTGGATCGDNQVATTVCADTCSSAANSVVGGLIPILNLLNGVALLNCLKVPVGDCAKNAQVCCYPGNTGANNQGKCYTQQGLINIAQVEVPICLPIGVLSLSPVSCAGQTTN